ncbi:MAG: hypothetical protein R3349_02515, partial [Geminicoccaceae bacterium]|nr:hypothetical protein [Geminicoccaceae bacterium]
QPALLAALVRARWDEETTSWQPPDAWVDRIRSAVAGFFGFPDWREPEPAMVAERLADELDVEGVLGIYRLTLNLPDPAVGVRLLEAMHGAADGILRDEALAETRAQIEELEARLEGETDPTRRTALEDLLARRYQAEATLSAGRAFAADLIDPPAASGWPASLHPLLVLAFAAFVGVIVGGFVVFLRDALRRGTT